MRSRRTVEDWRRVVFRFPITDKTKVYLLYLAEHMRTDRRVSVPRRTVADALGCSERRINDRNTEAVRAGLLDVVVRGQKGVTAVYVGQFPDGFSGTKSSPLKGAKSVPLKPGSAGQTGVPPLSKRPPTRYAVGDLPDEAREERSA